MGLYNITGKRGLTISATRPQFWGHCKGVVDIIVLIKDFFFMNHAGKRADVSPDGNSDIRKLVLFWGCRR